MNATALGAKAARRLMVARDATTVLAAFTVTLFVSAVLLFSVQPMFAKMVLPQLGGSPSVWAVSMCFFQAALLAGYCYAHALNRLLPARLVPLVHLCVMGAAVVSLPIGLPTAWSEPMAGDAYLWLMGLLVAGVGLPFFAISANAPLLQAWFARSGHPHAADPYFLYGASNLGSLIALLAYPVLLEPFAGLKTQAGMWTAGFIVLGLMIATCGALSVGRASSETAVAPTAGDVATDRPTWARRAGWVCLAFVPSGLLVAFTSYVTTDIAAAPFLWVVPLAMFLGTFILVFRDSPLVPHRVMLLLQPLVTAIVLFGIAMTGSHGWMMTAAGGTLAFFVTTMVCHKELYDQRPSSGHVTEFYLWMSFGGVLGGTFSALAAPQLFNSIWEFPLLLVLGMAMRPGFLKRPGKQDLRELAVMGGAAALVLVLMTAALSAGMMTVAQAELGRMAIIVTVGALAVVNSTSALRQTTFIALGALAVVLLPSAMNRGDAERSFFGVHRVTTIANGQVRTLLHGTTIHGAQRIKDEDGQPIDHAPVPMVYYHPGGPAARAVTAARRATGKSSAGFRAGVVGLGTGAMACHARADERWRFFEIDPVVLKIAGDRKQFTFLAACQPNADVVLGDARLTLAREGAGSFDYLLIDAFSSDAVPVHLLTQEAIALYLDRLSPNGILALHVSNRHLDLQTVASATAKALPGAFVALADDRNKGRGLDAVPSRVVLVTRSPQAFREVLSLPYVNAVDDVGVTPWTDDFSNIISALWRKARS